MTTNDNAAIIARMKGVGAKPTTAETDNDPVNPNVPQIAGKYITVSVSSPDAHMLLETTVEGEQWVNTTPVSRFVLAGSEMRVRLRDPRINTSGPMEDR